MKLKVYNTQWDRRDSYFFEVAQFHYYEGEEVKVKWAGAHEMGLKTNDSVGLRVIQRKNIREIDGQPYEYVEGLATAKKLTLSVPGSKGGSYTVTLGEHPECTCPGFQFRGTCKHLALAQNTSSQGVEHANIA